METTLREVHVVFRHGDRTPDKECLYPNDPHKEEDYYPFGYGQLINRGKKRAYQLGHTLRKTYGIFLGDTYTPDILDAWCSSYDRTKMTLQLVLASLFPPKNNSIWDETLLWQPIPYQYHHRTEDKLFLSCINNPIALEAYDQYLKGPGKNIVESNANILKYLEDNSGLNIRTPRDALFLASALSSQKGVGLKLPPWAERVWADSILDLVQCEYDILAATAKLKYLTVGKLFEKIVDDTRKKIDGKSNCKLRLYSGHEFTLSTLLRCLGTKYYKMPSYCANLIFEHHNIDGVDGFKIYHQTDLEQIPELLSFQNCGTFCPFATFLELIQEVLDEKILNPLF